MTLTPPVHYDCDVCCCAPCACSSSRSEPWNLDEGWVEEEEGAWEAEDDGEEMTLDSFVAEEHARIVRFAHWYRTQALDPENVTPEGEPMFPLKMAPGEWDQQILAFDDQGDEE